MDAKEYLEQVKHLNGKIKKYRLRIEELRTYSQRVSSVKLENTYIRSSGSDDSALDAIIDSIDAAISEQEACIEKLGEKIAEITAVIAKIDNTDAALLLTLRYIKLMRMTDIAELMGFSERYARKLHAKALKLVEVPPTQYEGSAA